MSRLYIKRRLKYKFGGYRKRSAAYICMCRIVSVLLIASIGLFFAGQRICSLAIRLGEVQLENEVRKESIRIADALFSEYTSDINSVITQNLDSNGKISSFTANFSALNNLKFVLTDKLTEYLISHEEIVCYVPLGALFSEDIFAAHGIKIPIKITSTGSAQVDFDDEFTSAGINQTRHRLMLKICTKVQLHTVYQKYEKNIITDIPITEVITVGDVPSIVTDTYK